MLWLPKGLWVRLFVISIITVCVATCAAGADNDPVGGQLIVFEQADASALARRFHAQNLPSIRTLASDLETSLRVIDVAGGAPEEVKITPLIVYQNYRGRSVYQGRYTDLDRIATFVRTSRAVPQGKEALRKENIAVRKSGRAMIAAPLKIAAVTGTTPQGYDHGAFAREARRSVYRGFADFVPAAAVKLGRGDRIFYMDFYPWLADDGTLFLSVALFSQFHCKKPIFTNKGQPLTGPWQERGGLFRQAGTLLEKAVERQMAASTIGDGFDPIPESVAVVPWEALGLGLPSAPRDATPVIEKAPKLSRRWTVSKPNEPAPPQVQFAFPAPLDMYAGEVKRVSGMLTLGERLSLTSAKGYFEADPTSVTMGEPDLDDALRGSAFLHVSKYATSRFTIRSVGAEGGPLAFGQASPLDMTGTFELKGVSVPLSVRATLEPILDDESRPRLLMQAAFSINLRDFKIEEADGPEPARHTLNFNVHLVLDPAVQ